MGNKKKGKADSGNKKGKRVVVRGAARHRASADHVQEKKLSRMLESNGPEAVADWAKKNGAIEILRKMTHRKNDCTGRPSKIAELAKLANAAIHPVK